MDLEARSRTAHRTQYCRGHRFRNHSRNIKKNELKPWQKRMWCIPPKQDAHFVAAVEDVLEVYARPHDPKRPLVCLDEAAKQLLEDVQEPLPMIPGHPLCYDSHYERKGTCSLFMLFEPLEAQRNVFVRDQRTAVDYAEVVRILCDEIHPDAEKIVLVQDNLNTHGAHSLYQAFEPKEALRLSQRIEWHFTPKHGSWLNMAELELSVLTRQCLRERMQSKFNVESNVVAWQLRRNQTATAVHWQFTTQDARIKLKGASKNL